MGELQKKRAKGGGGEGWEKRRQQIAALQSGHEFSGGIQRMKHWSYEALK
jgi:hypothetical protein